MAKLLFHKLPLPSPVEEVIWHKYHIPCISYKVNGSFTLLQGRLNSHCTLTEDRDYLNLETKQKSIQTPILWDAK